MSFSTSTNRSCDEPRRSPQKISLPEPDRRWRHGADEPAEPERRVRGAASGCKSAGPEAAAPSRQSEVGHFSQHAGRSEPGGYVRFETGAREVRQHGDGLEQGEEYRPAEPVRQAASDSEESFRVQEIR